MILFNAIFKLTNQVSSSCSCGKVITVRNVVATRLCFHRCLSFCPQGVYVADTPQQNPPANTPGKHPLGRHPPRWLLQWTVCILLECILVVFFKTVLEYISPFCGATDTPVLNFWWCLLWVSKPEWATLFAHGEAYVLHVPWDSPLVWHLLTSWQPTWQPSHSLPHTCEQALVGLETRTYHAAAYSVRPGRSFTNWALLAQLWEGNFLGVCLSTGGSQWTSLNRSPVRTTRC